MAKKISGSEDNRVYMQMAVDAMFDSIDEPRSDGKVNPKVGAVLVKSNGEVQTAFRGELRYGDHAEFALLERKNRSEALDRSKLFTTLEPCAPGARRHPKLGCAERIVNARIGEVWVGIEDPDPTVDRKGIKYLEDHGIKVKIFDRDLQTKIRDANKEFLEQALSRADDEGRIPEKINLSSIEEGFGGSDIAAFSTQALQYYLRKTQVGFELFSPEFWAHFERIGMVERLSDEVEGGLRPTGVGLILFGERPREAFPQAGVKAKVKYGNERPVPTDFGGPLVLVPEEIENWLKKVLPGVVDRKGFERQASTLFPIEPLREAIVNALVHRDYEIAGAKVGVEIDDQKIVVTSPGLPVEPISLDEVKEFRAPTLSRNPKIAFVFNRLGFMEEAELGMETFRSMMDRYSLPIPTVSFREPYLSLTFGRSLSAKKSSSPVESTLSDEEFSGLEWIRSRGTVSRNEYAVHLSISDKKAQRQLSKMKNLALVRTVGRGKDTRYESVS